MSLDHDMKVVAEQRRLWHVYTTYQAQQALRDDEWYLDVSTFFGILERYCFAAHRDFGLGRGWILYLGPPPVIWPPTWKEIAQMFHSESIFSGLALPEKYRLFLCGVACAERYMKCLGHFVDQEWL